jgi:hypothetical protein
MSKTDQSTDPSALFNTWLEFQNEFVKGQKSLYPGVEATASAAVKQTMDAASESWSSWEKQAADWIKVANNWLPADLQSNSSEALVAESLRRMLDPKFFSYAALDEASGSVQRMAEGPEFADIGFVEKHLLQSTAEWFAMREADARYRQITGNAWGRAFQTFTTEMSVDWARYYGDSRKVLDRWLEIANDELIKTQRQQDYLDASRKLFRATIEYRLKQRELAEIWCESQSIPTRTEVDDLHRTVTELRRELRALKRQVAGSVVKPATVKRKQTVQKPAAKVTKKSAGKVAGNHVNDNFGESVIGKESASLETEGSNEKTGGARTRAKAVKGSALKKTAVTKKRVSKKQAPKKAAPKKAVVRKAAPKKTAPRETSAKKAAVSKVTTKDEATGKAVSADSAAKAKVKRPKPRARAAKASTDQSSQSAVANANKSSVASADSVSKNSESATGTNR